MAKPIKTVFPLIVHFNFSTKYTFVYIYNAIIKIKITSDIIDTISCYHQRQGPMTIEFEGGRTEGVLGVMENHSGRTMDQFEGDQYDD